MKFVSLLSGRPVNELLTTNVNKEWNNISGVGNDVYCLSPSNQVPADNNRSKNKVWGTEC